MNKLIIGLLIIAAGAGVYFLLSKKKNSTETAVIKKELIIGTWKIESYQPATDSLQPKYSYDFQKDGMAVAGGKLWIIKKDAKYWLKDENGGMAQLTISNVYLSNGVIHVIDHVVLPK